ncbi:hypothetical protein RSAG8_13109, partial [Rhizoctonia solani AG-8 WAC10335]
MSSFRIKIAEEEQPKTTYKWDMGRFKVFARDFVNHNRWAVLGEKEVENCESLNELTQQMAETYDSVADDLQLKKVPSNNPPIFKKYDFTSVHQHDAFESFHQTNHLGQITLADEFKDWCHLTIINEVHCIWV